MSTAADGDGGRSPRGESMEKLMRLREIRAEQRGEAHGDQRGAPAVAYRVSTQALGGGGGVGCLESATNFARARALGVRRESRHEDLAKHKFGIVSTDRPARNRGDTSHAGYPSVALCHRGDVPGAP